MFLVAVKTAIVEALRATFDAQFTDGAKPRRIDIEYVEDQQDWPFILVQFHVNTLTWTGIYPDEEIESDPPSSSTKRLYRQGLFDGYCDLSIYALTSEERDRMWDHIAQLLLMGRKNTATNDFYESIANHDLIAITIMEGQVQPQGDAIGVGTPWDSDTLIYEATIRFDLVGQFWVDATTLELAILSDATAHPYREDEEPYGASDGQGSWEDWEG